MPPKLSDFALEAFPDTFHDTALEIHAASFVPIPQVCASMLAVAGILCRSGIAAREPGRKSPIRPNLNVVSAGHPGSGKSVADGMLHAPIEGASTRFDAGWKSKISSVLRERESLEIELSELKKNRKKTDPEAYAKTYDRIQQRLALIETLLKTTGPTLDVSDATEAAHAEQLAINQAYWELLGFSEPNLGGCLAVVSKDGGKALSWIAPIRVAGGDFVSQSGTALASWDGVRVKAKRVGRAAIVANEAISSFLLTVTPPTFKKFLTNPNLHGDGLSSRFLFVLNEAWQRKERPKSACQATLDEYNRKMLELFERFGMAGYRSEVRVSEAASARLDEFRCTIIDLACTKLLDVRDLTVRWTEMALKMALILHLMEHGADAPDHEIDAKRAAAGCRLMTWYANHLVSILGDERKDRMTAIQKTIAKILAERGDEGMKIGEGWRRGIGKNTTESKEYFLKEFDAKNVKIVFSWLGGRETATAFLPTAETGIAAAEAQREQAIVERTADKLSVTHSLDPAQSSLQSAVVGDGGEVPNWKPRTIRGPLKQSELRL